MASSMLKAISGIMTVEMGGTFMDGNTRYELFCADDTDPEKLILAAEDRRGNTRRFAVSIREVDDAGNPLDLAE